MDSLEKVFKAKGYDKSHPELYEKLVKYRKILEESEPTVTNTPKTTSASPKPKNKLTKIVLGALLALMILGGVFLAKKNSEKAPEKKFA